MTSHIGRPEPVGHLGHGAQKLPGPLDRLIRRVDPGVRVVHKHGVHARQQLLGQLQQQAQPGAADAQAVVVSTRHHVAQLAVPQGTR